MSFALLGNSSAQKSTFAVHVSNPISMFRKAGLKLEYRTSRVGVLLMGTKYYGSLPKYPGEQGGVELRLYSKNEEQKTANPFLYTKVYAGHQDYFAGSGSGFTRVQDVPEGDYYGLGAGWGKHINFNPFFIDFNAGLKFTHSEVAQDIAFYITGPASYLDLQFNLGFQF